ncbi:T9SS type A sorting domain-containing protein [Taibaiella koreensis]|uniref:T9SS type A sorting domain-containing protein n=1 Tax=Taibaiella koreensis TaxID=1268548 RepID=UPI000E59D0E3|nr:T9SS type A sorting domain-containing protein [Taibaiella koreensis]
MQSAKDTTVLGKPARMLVSTRYQRFASSSTVAIGRRDTFYVYNTNDTVFAYDKVIANFTPLYVFNVSAGDTVCLRQPNSSLGSSSVVGPEFCIIIDSIKQEDYGGTQLMSYYNHTIGPDNKPSLGWGTTRRVSDGGLINVGKYTEKIGGNWPKLGSFFPEFVIANPDYYKRIGFPTGTLRCYSDSVTNIKMVPQACDTIIVNPLSISPVAESQYRISVFPNPSTGIFRLTVQKPLNEALALQVADLGGRILHRALWPAGKTALDLDLEQLDEGIYLLVLQANGQRYYQKLIIGR